VAILFRREIQEIASFLAMTSAVLVMTGAVLVGCAVRTIKHRSPDETKWTKFDRNEFEQLLLARRAEYMDVFCNPGRSTSSQVYPGLCFTPSSLLPRGEGAK